MNKLKYIYSTIAFLCFTFYCSSQTEVTIQDILQKANEACLSLNSIEYKIHQRNAIGKYGFPTIEATIIQQRANVSDVGFDKAYIKVTGTIEEKGEKESFNYAYNGDDFTYQRGNNSAKKINSPKRYIVMGMLQQHLFMLRFFPFTQDEPFKSRGGRFEYEGKETVNETLCYKIKSVTLMQRQGASDGTKKRTLSTTEIWWIRVDTYLPVAFSDGFLYKEATILNYD